jgi:DNA-binding transcriptional LysR family regulator
VRLGSTVAAAAELAVTHGAVSKQVALLERWLGVTLFERGRGRLVPTAEAGRYAAALASALDLVERSTEVLQATGPDLPRLVRLTTTGSVASLWLVPRLAAFRALNPGIEVWVSESRELSALGQPGGPELALRLGRGPWSGVRAEALMTDDAVVVCAPSVAARLKAPQDLARVTLLHDEDPRLSWQAWLEAAGLGRPAWGHRGPRLADGGLLLQAARAGQGVALSRRRLAASLLRTGALVQPFPTRLALGPSYWLVLPPQGTPLSARAEALADWLRETARQEESAAPS